MFLRRRRRGHSSPVRASALTLALLAVLLAAAEPAGAGGRTTEKAAGGVRMVRLPAAGTIVTPVLRVRAAPTVKARAIKLLAQFRPDYRPTIVFALAAVRIPTSGYWLKVELPGRPNGRTGWVRWNSVRLSSISTRIVVDRGKRTLAVYQDGRLRFHTRVAVGAPGMETPTGRFYIQAAYRASERALGIYAFETSAYSRLSDWPGGGVVGIHGTPQPQLLGQAASHGCIRISNDAALVLKKLVPLGSEVVITD